MKTVERASKDVTALLNKALREWHQDLKDAEVKIGVVMVTCEDGPAITDNGAPAIAKVRRLNERDRLLMDLDATIEIDAAWWDESEEERRIALLDHELTHLEVDGSKSAGFKRHADGRPKLAMQPDDWQISGFYEVVERHGASAPDAIAIRKVVESGQLTFPFMLQDFTPSH
ncbi:hypothetical protein LLG95_12990, partial [bacterium]|nr:hypothetical protein [bacterium]